MSMDSYAAAHTAYVDVDKDVDKIAELISQVGQALSRTRKRLLFSNFIMNLPAGLHASPDKVSIDANDWKSAAQIMQSLVNWHTARDALIMEWASLTSDEQTALNAPPRGVLPDTDRPGSRLRLTLPKTC